MKKEDIKKVVLAYSGGLDTSIIIPWLKENYNNCEVIAVSGDVGQGTELDGLEEKAKATGASKLYVLDLKKDFVENYIFPTLKFGAKYEDYLLGTSFARPCIAKALADIAIKEGADAICHGCTGKGNDQVRFELTLKALCPDMAIIAPWREWDIESRDEEIDYAEAHNIPLKINRETNYSKDKNLWHLSHEGLDLENPANEPQYNKPGFLELGVSPEQAPDTPTYLTLHFEKGIPTAVDGKEMGAVELVEYLNQRGGKKMIAEYESADRPAHSKLDAPKSYGLGLAHKHLPEMQKISGLAHTPAFVPVVCDYYSGMQVLVPLDLKLAGTSAEAAAAGIADYYREGATVSVHALNEPLPENGLYSNALSGSDRMELYMTVNAAGDQMLLVSLFDNLGKGSSGAAIQCMNLMLGMNETEGLE